MQMKGNVRIQFGELLGQIEELYSGEGGQATVFILPDSIAIAQVGEKLLEKHGAVDLSRFATFEQLASRIVRAATGVTPLVLPEHIRDALAANVVENLPAMEGSQLKDAGFSSALLREFDSVWPSVLLAANRGETPLKNLDDTGAETGMRAGLLREFASAYRARMKGLESAGVYDRVLLADVASRNAACLRDEGIVNVAVVDMAYADGVLLELLREISSVCRLSLLFRQTDRGRLSVGVTLRALDIQHSAEAGGNDEPGLPAVEIFGAPDRKREITEVARRILRTMKETGLCQSDFAIVARSIADYSDIGRETLKEYGLETGGERRRLQDLRLYVFLRCLLEATTGELTKSKITALLEHDFFPASRESLREALEAIAHFPEVTSWDALVSAFGGIAMPTGESLRGWLESVHVRSSASMSLRAWAERSVELLGVASIGILGDEEYEGNMRLVERLKELSSLDSVSKIATGETELSARRFTEMLDLLAQGVSYSSAETGTERVLFTDAGLLYFGTFRHVFALGMGEDVFPVRPRDGMFLKLSAIDSISERDCLARASTDAINSIEGHHYDALLACAENITFSYIYSDERGRRHLPSTFVLQTLEKASGGNNLMERLEERNLEFSSFFPDDGVAFTVNEVDRMRAASLSEWGNDSDVIIGLSARAVSDFSGIAARREIADADRREWMFDGERLRNQTRAKILSATDLSEYSKCPFRYVASRVLSVVPLTPPLSPLAKGSQMHEILRRFYGAHSLAELRKLGSGGAAIEMMKCADDYFSQIYGGAGGLDLRFAIHVADVRSDLSEFVRGDVEAEMHMGGEIAGLEQRFGYSDQKEFRIGSHRYRGIIDRVETEEESGRVILYDYKSGNPDSLTRRYFRSGAEPLDFGIPLYALYLRDVEHREIAGAFYYMLLKTPGKPDKAGLVEREAMAGMFPIPERRKSFFSILTGAGFDRELDSYRDLVLSISDNIVGCNFPLSPREGECTRCGYYSVCRYGGGRE